VLQRGYVGLERHHGGYKEMVKGEKGVKKKKMKGCKEYSRVNCG
jgi:hypothetical protein